MAMSEQRRSLRLCRVAFSVILALFWCVFPSVAGAPQVFIEDVVISGADPFFCQVSGSAEGYADGTPLSIVIHPAEREAVIVAEGDIHVKGGRFDWKAELPCYSSGKYVVMVVCEETGMYATGDFHIDPLPGSLAVAASPGPVHLFIDNDDMGDVNGFPRVITGLSAGSHELELQKDGYTTHIETVEIIPRETVEFYVHLHEVPAYGWLAITSIPTEADLFIDGENKGTTDIVIHNLTTGVHDLYLYCTVNDTFENTSYEAWRTVDIPAGEGVQLFVHLDEIPSLTNLIIETHPSYADIYFDGALVGQTPHVIYDFPEGDHSVILKKEGYLDCDIPLIVPEDGLIITRDLVPLPATGIVSCSSTPNNASVYVDGVIQGHTDCILYDLDPGVYRVEIRKDGYFPWAKTVTLDADSALALSANLVGDPSSSSYLPPTTPAVMTTTGDSELESVDSSDDEEEFSEAELREMFGLDASSSDEEEFSEEDLIAMYGDGRSEDTESDGNPIFGFFGGIADAITGFLQF